MSSATKLDDFRYPIIDVSGPARARGRQYGEQAADLIRANVDHYRTVFEQDSGLLWRQAEARTRDLLPAIEKYAPDSVDELRGVAEGADLPLDSVITLNCRTELLHARPECTVASVLPSRSADGHTWAAQNWDWLCGAAETTVLLRLTDEDGRTFVSLHEAGYLARGGYNNAGVACLGNFLMTDRDRRSPGMPLPFIGRRMLLAADLASSYQHLLNAPERTVSTNCAFTSRDGLAVNIEATPDRTYAIRPKDGLLVHSNHFQTPGVVDTGIALVPDSLYRDVRLHELLDTAEAVDRELLMSALRDHAGHPYSICRHPSQGPSGTRDETIASIVIDLTTGELWIADGNPCERPYRAFGRFAEGGVPALVTQSSGS